MGNLQVRFLEGWAPAMAPGHSTKSSPGTSSLRLARLSGLSVLVRIRPQFFASKSYALTETVVKDNVPGIRSQFRLCETMISA